MHPLNLLNVLRQVSIAGLIAIGMTFVILTAGIDLSVGALLALAGMVGAYVAKGGLADRFAIGEGVEAGNPFYLALLAALLVGIAGGAAQGFVITRFSVPPFVVTLGGLTIFRGLTLLLSGGGPISAFQPDYTWWGQGRVDLWFIADVPVPAIIFVVAAILAHIVLHYTRFGLHVFATGANRVAATLNGVPTRRIIFLVYVIVGFSCGLAAFLLSARLSSAEAVAGDGLELTVIAAVRDRRDQPLRRGRRHPRHGGRHPPDRRAHQRPGAAQCVVLRPADRDRSGAHRGSRVRPVRDPQPSAVRSLAMPYHVLDLRAISRSFGAIQALADVDLALSRGEVLGLMGDNGAGKSTLVKFIAGNFPPTSGTDPPRWP